MARKFGTNNSGKDRNFAEKRSFRSGPFRNFEIGVRSVPVPKFSELIPERERKFRSGPTTDQTHSEQNIFQLTRPSRHLFFQKSCPNSLYNISFVTLYEGAQPSV